MSLSPVWLFFCLSLNSVSLSLLYPPHFPCHLCPSVSSYFSSSIVLLLSSFNFLCDSEVSSLFPRLYLLSFCLVFFRLSLLSLLFSYRDCTVTWGVRYDWGGGGLSGLRDSLLCAHKHTHHHLLPLCQLQPGAFEILLMVSCVGGV